LPQGKLKVLTGSNAAVKIGARRMVIKKNFLEEKNQMKLKKFTPLLRGAAATTAALLTLSTVAYGVAKSDLAVGWVDGFFGIEDRTLYEERTTEIPSYTIPGSLEGFSYLKGTNFKKNHATAEAYEQALYEHAIREGEEGFALLRNENDTLPLKSNSKIALFGWNCYNIPSGHTGVVAGNYPHVSSGWGGGATYDPIHTQITLKTAFDNIDSITVNDTVTADDFTGKMNSAGGYKDDRAFDEVFTANDAWNITSDTIAIVAVGRGGGEGSNYKPDTSNEEGKDPLQLGDAELAMIKYAKEHCAKVVLLVVSANAMELGPAVQKGGEYEVDAIGFCGIPNDYQYQGIANVLAGKVNATGGLTDTYLYDNSFNPATINMGQQQYSDTNTISAGGDLLGRSGSINYRANNYIVEAEGIYVGYKYYETRYYDSIANPDYKATATIGSTKKGEAWNYANEVIYTFGHGLSYIPYTQEITDVKVNLSEGGSVTATVKVTNNGTKDGYFLAQLYVNRPYTQYDIEHKVEKSAVDFLNSKKVSVKKGESETIRISVPTRYLASWDSTALNGKGTYILDQGDYLFTAAPGAHAAVNNFLKEQEKTTDETTVLGTVVKWNLAEFDDETFATSNGVEVRNQMQNADINYYYGEEKVKYLTRSDWEGTFPKNYTNYTNGSGIAPEDPFTLAGAAKLDEWIRELQNAQYKVTPVADESKWVNVTGVIPDNIGEGKEYASVWEWLLRYVAVEKPEAFSDIHSNEWQTVAKALNLGTSLNSVGESGGTSKTFAEIGNPNSKQTESVVGYAQVLPIGNEGKNVAINVASNTLLGSSFNPDLAYEWGLLEGEGGLWLQDANVGGGTAMTVWGAGLNQHRHAYNGRNSEYMSEDPMLTNRIGEAQMRGAVEKGAICGPKHMGFNDQELNRQGNATYMTEQKVRETDTRCYEGALRVDEGNGTGVMMSFARIGATNCTNSVGYVKNIMREEWGFTGIISTDFGQSNYHEVGSMIMATINEYAGMGRGTEYTNSTEDTATITKANYITLGDARKDPAFAAQARQTALYILFTQARTGSGIYVERRANMGEDIVVPATTNTYQVAVGKLEIAGWEGIFIALEVVFGVLTALAGGAWIASLVLPEKEEN